MPIINNLKTRFNDDGTVTFIGKTLLKGRPYEVTVKVEDLDRYNEGTLMQEAFPYLTSEQRELLISGCDDKEWDKLMKPR